MKDASELVAQGDGKPQHRTCERHGAYPYRSMLLAGRTIELGCPACTAEARAKDEERERRMKAEADRVRVEGLILRSGIPPRFRLKRFEDFEAADEGQQRALRVARAYASEWPEMLRRGTCLIFSGKAGTGKTHLACAIANAVLAAGHSALFTTVSDALRAIRRAYDKDAGISETEAIGAFARPDLLILDEIGADYGTDHSKTILFDLINRRYEHVKPTIILTNLDAESLREHCGDRIMDRLREGGGKLIPFTWESSRK